ncbi:MAG: TonB-dependent receptor [Bacteroidia bacterium]|nr:TonB-dependent receptor [Bacteroidia bacterium]
MNHGKKCTKKITNFSVFSKFFIIFLLIQVPISVYSQKNLISGKITDSSSNNPLPFCTVRILNITDSTLLAGTISDSLGIFQLEVNKKGIYLCVLNYIGYNEKRIKIEIKNKKTELGIIQLQAKFNQIREIQINAAQKSKSLVDRFIYRVDSSDLVKAVTSLDVMKKIPDLSVSDINKSISIKGKNSSLILINGVNRGGTINLLSINPKDIEKVELIYNPTSEYENDVDGVINIVLKNTPTKGSSGEFDITYRAMTKSVEPVFIYQYGIQKARFSVNYYPSYKSIPIETILNRNTKIADSLTYKYNSKYTSNNRNEITNLIQGSIDYYVNDKNFINFFFETNLLSSKFNNKLENSSLGLDSIYTNSLNISKTFYNVNNGNFYFKKSFAKEEQELTINNNFHFMKAEYLSIYNDTIRSSITDLTQYNDRETNETGEKIANNVKIDYLHPISEFFRISTGMLMYYQKFSYSLLTNIITSTEVLKNLKWHYYLDMFIKIKKIDIRCGSKVENYISDLNNNRLNNQTQILPSIIAFTQLNNNNSLRLGYRKTAFYPSAWQLMPNLIYTDSYNAIQGNSELKPTNQHKVEMSHTIRKKAFSLSSALYYSYLYNMIASIRKVDNQNISIRKIENIDGKTTIGADFSFNYFYKEIFSIKPTVNLYREWFNNSNDNRINYSYKGSLNVNYTYKEKNTIGAYIIVTGRELTVQGYYYVNPSIEGIYIQRVLLKGAGCITIGYINPFLSSITKSVIEDSNFNQVYLEKIDTPCFFINFFYNFAKGIELSMKRIDRQIEKDLK